MTKAVEVLGLYLHLARASQQRRRLLVRDRLLVLAATIASQLELHRVSAYCRHLILQHNPHHMVNRWPSVEKALEDEDFAHYLRHLGRRYPLERAEQMLGQLGIEITGERRAYYTDEEYAAALLGSNPEHLDTLFGPDEV